MRRPPVSPARQNAIDALAENDRQRWLVRTYPAGDPRRRSDRRVVGVHETSRPADRVVAGGRERARRRAAPSGGVGPALGAVGLIALLVAGMWLALGGLVWLGFELARWVVRIFGWGSL